MALSDQNTTITASVCHFLLISVRFLESQLADVLSFLNFHLFLYIRILIYPLLLSCRHMGPYRKTDALIKDIETDKQVALTSAARPAYLQYKSDPFFARASKLDPPEIDPGAKRVKPGEKI